MPNIVRFSLLLVGLMVGTVVSAATGVGSVSFTPFSVKGLTVSKTINIDSAFAKKYRKSVAAPFRIQVPVSKKFLNYYDPKVGGPSDTTLLKISFVTKEKQIIENIRLVPVQIGMGDPVLRIKTAAHLLSNQAFADASKGYLNAKLLGIAQTKINGADGVVGVGQFEDPTIGLLYVRLVVILNPKDRHSILAFATINPKLSAANKPDLLHKAGISYKLIESIGFLGR
ncbi:MAG: hypothetical protein GXP09_05730 [Gammaproteobacteria bacterium]|nr:hypothetical protein [Gammaproteobacteria bacterium]